MSARQSIRTASASWALRLAVGSWAALCAVGFARFARSWARGFAARRAGGLAFGSWVAPPDPRDPPDPPDRPDRPGPPDSREAPAMRYFHGRTETWMAPAAPSPPTD